MYPLYFHPCLIPGQAPAGNNLGCHMHSSGYLSVSLHFELVNDNGAEYNPVGAVTNTLP